MGWSRNDPVSEPEAPACAPPDPGTVPEEHRAPAHPGGFYWSTYCMHGAAGDGDGSECRHACKLCHKPCMCRCHGGATVPFEGFDLAEEDRLRRIAFRIAAEHGVPPGTRGDELVAGIATGMLVQLRKEAERSGPDGLEQG